MPDDKSSAETVSTSTVEPTVGDKIATIVQDMKAEVGDKPAPDVVTIGKQETEKPKPRKKSEKKAAAPPPPQEDDEAVDEEPDTVETAEDTSDKSDGDGEPDYREWDAAVETARAIGMPEDDIDGYDSPEELRGAVRLAKKLIARQQDNSRRSEKREEPRPDKSEPTKKSRAFTKKLDAEQYDKGITDYLDEMNAHYATQLEEIEARASEAHEKYGKFEQAQQRAEQERQMAEIEDAMKEVPDSIKSLIAFGKSEDAINGAQREARERLGEAVDKELSFANAKGRRLSVAQAIQKALRAEFFEELSRSDVDKLKSRLNERGASIIPRGNGRTQAAGRDVEDDRLDEIWSKLRR